MRSIVLFAAACLLVLAADSRAAESWLIPADKIYTSPEASPIVHGAVLVFNGRISAVDDANTRRRLSKNTKTATQCGGVVVAGFQNSHVHFIEPRFQDSANLPAEQLSRDLEAMLTRWGFTTVFDVASDEQNTLALRKRIESGAVRGPRIRTVGDAIFPVDGIPSYIHDLPADVLARMHQPKSADEARADVRANIAAGADGTKLFMQTSPARDVMRFLQPEIVRAAVEQSHALGKPVFAHPTSIPGLQLAVNSGVDVIVHTTLGEREPWSAELVRKMVEKHVAVIPTFELWYYELAKENVPAAITDQLVDATLEELRTFRAAGGQVLFGTDVGYMHAYDTAREYELMAKAGMSVSDILASLTTAPAARWNDDKFGRVEAGYQADLVVLGGDPADDVKNFANVRCVFRAGKLIYASGKSP